MILKEYYETKEFAKLANVSEKKIYRDKEKYLLKNPNTKKIKHKSKPYKFHHSLLKDYVSEEVYGIILKAKSQNNTILCLKKTDSLGYTLFKMDWTWWCTVAYKNELTGDACRNVMDNLYKTIEDKYGDLSHLRMFYTTESFSTKEGHHNHFVFNASNPDVHYAIKQDIVNLIGKDRHEIETYDETQPCIFYSCKEGLQGTGWDIYGNNLAEDGKAYENKSYRKAI